MRKTCYAAVGHVVDKMPPGVWGSGGLGCGLSAGGVEAAVSAEDFDDAGREPLCLCCACGSRHMVEIHLMILSGRMG